MAPASSPFEQHYRPVIFWVITLGLLAAAVWLLRPFLPALSLAVVLSVLMNPLYRRWKALRGENMAALATVFATIFIVLIPLVIAVALLYSQLSGLVGQLQEVPGETASIETFVADADKRLAGVKQQIGVQFDLVEWFNKNRDRITEAAQQGVGQVAVTAGKGIFSIVVALFVMFYMLRDGHRLREPAAELLPFAKERSFRMFERVGATIRAVFLAVVVVSAVQSTLAFLTYWACGAPSPAVLAAITFIFCLIPLLGAPAVYVPVALILFSQGKVVPAIIVLVVGFGVISQIDNLLRPYYIGSYVSFHVVGVFLSLLGGVLTIGPLGLMVGPVLLTLLLGLQEVIRESRLAGDALEAPA